MFDQLMAGLGIFMTGWAIGGMSIIYIAQRPQGYKAGNGKRYCLTEINN